jgi:hypothetical protein
MKSWVGLQKKSKFRGQLKIFRIKDQDAKGMAIQGLKLNEIGAELKELKV